MRTISSRYFAKLLILIEPETCIKQSKHRSTFSGFSVSFSVPLLITVRVLTCFLRAITEQSDVFMRNWVTPDTHKNKTGLLEARTATEQDDESNQGRWGGLARRTHLVGRITACWVLLSNQSQAQRSWCQLASWTKANVCTDDRDQGGHDGGRDMPTHPRQQVMWSLPGSCLLASDWLISWCWLLTPVADLHC